MSGIPVNVPIDSKRWAHRCRKSQPVGAAVARTASITALPEKKSRCHVTSRLKPSVESLAALRAAVEPIADGPVEILDQEDIFFQTTSGRLKLRVFAHDRGELILYQRANVAGPKTSDYRIAPTTDPAALQAILASALSVLGVVKKRRWLYLVGQTRVHLDRVEGLGEFVELEVVLRHDQAAEEGDGNCPRSDGQARNRGQSAHRSSVH